MHTGIGLRTAHYEDLINQKPDIGWIEVHSENYFSTGNKARYYLEKARELYPVSLHGLSLSIASSDALNKTYLKQLKRLIEQIDPFMVSDHLSWSSLGGNYYPDLFPLPYTEESLKMLTQRLQAVQDYLQREILIENISSYLQFKDSTISECDFLRELAIQSQCGILLDVNNVYINSKNFKFDPHQYISAIPGHLVKEIHLAGYEVPSAKNNHLIIDTHNKPVSMPVWTLFTETIRLMGPKPTLIEWDYDLPSLACLCSEALHAEKIIRNHGVAE